MSETSKAVFLSYASQDAVAVERIAEVLRAAGVEVWFDRNELVGGDAWDAKIRKQIAECALFVPVISANTQARLEGYFRLEWKLAAQRTHMMAEAKPFLLPVVIDATRDAEAHVPTEFKTVQWVRLRPTGYAGLAPDEAALGALCRRVKQLLGGDVAGVADSGGGVKVAPASARPATTKPARLWLGWAALALAVLVALFFLRPWNKPPPIPEAEGGGSPRAKGLVKTEADTAASLTARAFEHYYPFCTPGRLQLAEEFSRRATNLDPNYAPGWGARAGANARYLLRDWVSGEAARQRAREAQSFANRALSLDKNDTEALLALGIVAWHQRATGQAETLFRRVMTVDPANVQAPTLLSRVAREGGRAVEAVALMKDAVARAPRDPMVRLYAGFAYFDGWNFRQAAEQFEAASQVADFQGARVYKAWAEFFESGDVVRMRAELDKLDLVYAEDDGKLAMNLVCALYERRADRVVETAGRSASSYLDDWWTPKAWFTALAFEFERKENLARQQWQAAEAVVRERLKADPQDEILRVNLAITLAKLGRATEVRADFDSVEAAWREQVSPIRALRLARFHAAAGDAARAVEWLRQCVNRPTFLDENVTPRTLALDPWWDGIRGNDEFRALLANPPTPPMPVAGPEATKESGAGSAAPADEVHRGARLQEPE